MTRPHRSIAAAVIAIVTIVTLVTGFGGFDGAVLESFWVLLPGEAPATYVVVAVRTAEQPSPLLSLLSPRAPPTFLHA